MRLVPYSVATIVAVQPGELRVDDVAAPDPVAARRVLEQRGPLLGDVAVVEARRQRVAVAERNSYCTPMLKVRSGA